MYHVKPYALDDVTVYTITHTDAAGEEHDLSPHMPCLDREDLRGLVRELHAQGAYDAATMETLIATVGAL